MCGACENVTFVMTESLDEREFHHFQLNLALSKQGLIGLDTPLPEVTRERLFVFVCRWFVDFSGQFVTGPAGMILNMNDSLFLYTVFQSLKVSHSPQQAKQANKQKKSPCIFLCLPADLSSFFCFSLELLCWRCLIRIPWHLREKRSFAYIFSRCILSHLRRCTMDLRVVVKCRGGIAWCRQARD